MVDIAALGIAIDSTSADKAAASLDGMVAAGGRAEEAAKTLASEAQVAMSGLLGMSDALADIDHRTDALRSSVDPLAMAMKKANAEMAEADALYKLGALGADEYTRYLGVLEGRLETAVAAQNAMTAAQQRGQAAARLTTHEIGNMGRQFADIGVMAAMGMNPLMILIQQGPQIADIFSTAGQRGMGFKAVVVDIGKQMGILTTVNTAAAASSEAAAAANVAQAVSAQAAAAAEGELAVAANAAASAQTRLAAASGAAALGAEGAAVAAGTAAAANVAMAETATAAAAAEAVALAPVAAILLAIAGGVALVTGLFAGGFAIATQQINRTAESADELQKRLGLTDDQMKKLAKDGVDTAVTMGDTFSATTEVIGEALWEVFGPTLTELGDNIAEFYQNAVDWALNMARETVGVIGGAVGGIKAVWGLLPAAFADIMITAANSVIEIVEKMVNSVVDKIQTLLNLANAGAMFLGFGPIFGQIEDVVIPRLTNTFEGAGQTAVGALVEGARSGRDDAVAGFDDVLADIDAKARAKRDERLKKAAGDAKPGSTRKEGLSEEEKAYQKAVEAAEDYIEALKDEAATLNMNAIAAKEYEIAKRAAAAPTAELAQAIRDEGLALTYQMQVRAANLDAMDRELAVLAMERDMIGATAREREIALAGLREEQRLRLEGVTDEILIASAVGKRKQIAAETYDLRTAQQAYNDELSHTANLLADIDAQAQDAARGIAQAFGKVGAAMGDVLTLMTRYAAKQEELRVRRRADGVTAEEVARIDREAARDKIAYYGDMISAAKGFFDEQSDGYKALQAIEAGYRAWQMAMSIQASVQAMAEAAAKVTADTTAAAAHTAAAGTIMATDAATTSTGIAAGAARMFAALGPYAFPVVAAMVAVMASLGAGSGGGGGTSVSISERRQREQGTGTVLGDAAAKSESITRSLEIVASNTNRDLEYSNDMLRALRSIDDQIGVVAAALARQLGASGILDTSGLNLGTSGSKPTLSNLGFGSTTTRTLKDIGLDFGAQSLADILSKGIAGAAYQVIKTTSESSAFGITYSSSSSTKTKKTALDAGLAEEFSRLIESLRDGVVSAATVLGVEGADAVLASFQVNLGKISLKDMTGSEIEEALNAVFSKVGDEMAAAVVPSLRNVQNVGEGLFETLTRVARQYQVIDVTLATVGKTFGMVGVSSIEARERLVDLFGSLGDFTEQTAFYAENYLTEAERLAPIQQAVTAELARLGLSSVKTRDQFKSVVQGLDVSTAAGAELFAALMALAPAFAKVTEESQALSDAKDELSRAYERESETLADSIDRFTGLAGDLRKYRDGLYTGPAAALSPEAQYQAAKAEFDRINGLVGAGNTSVLDDAQAAFEAFREASRQFYGSGRGYFDDLDAIRGAASSAEALATTQADVAEQQLEQLKSQVSVLIDIDTSVKTVAEAIAALQALMGGAGSTLAAASSGSSTTSSTDNNAAVVAQLQETNERLEELVEWQRAQIEQQAAISAAQQARLQAIEDQLARQNREIQAA
ncbi:MAG: phage tail length tape measure family protein [Pseudomonadota bacterium]